MKKLYIINDGELNGFTYDKYTDSHESIGQLLVETAYVHIADQQATHILPKDAKPSDWLQVDDSYIPGMIATESGWKFQSETSSD